VLALKRVARLQSGESITSERISEAGDYPVYGGNGLRGYTSSFTHEGRFVLVGRQGALCGNVNYSSGTFWASEHAVVATPVKSVNTTWLGELLRAMNLNQYSVSAAQPGLSVELISNLGVPYPPLEEQSAIASFLDRETSKIDALIAEQERLLELLAEKRQAVISHAVTKGLNSDAPMKDSGVVWLGEVPAHWEVRSLRTLSTVVRGASPRPAGDPQFFNGDYIPWVTVAEITKDSLIDLTKTEGWLTEDGAAKSRVFRAGTVIYSNSGATLGVPKILRVDACANDGVVGFENLSDLVDPTFLCHYLSSLTETIRDMVKQGSGQPNLNTGLVKALPISLPNRQGQLEICARIRVLTEKFHDLSSDVLGAIALLRERRTALIAAAVTGQIDVREAA
jgi:type I restriction enzyme S subunit